MIVTGAGQGLGRSTALGFGRRGAKVALVDNNEATLSDVVMEMPNHGVDSISIAADIAADIAAAGAAGKIVQKTTDFFGRLDVLANNAAVSSVEPFLEVTEGEWDKVFAINVKALFFLLQATARVMKNTGGGRIINVSSPAARMTREEYVAYSTSKAAVDYITRTAAAALGCYGITVNAVAPGPDGHGDAASERNRKCCGGWSQFRGLCTFTYCRYPTAPAYDAGRSSGRHYLAGDGPASYVTANRLNISGGLELD